MCGWPEAAGAHALPRPAAPGGWGVGVGEMNHVPSSRRIELFCKLPLPPFCKRNAINKNASLLFLAASRRARSFLVAAGHPSGLGARSVLAYPPASGQVPWAWVGPGHVAPLSQIPLALAQHPGWSREGRGKGRLEGLQWQVIRRTLVH